MTNEAREQEIWKQYPDYPFIEVSNLGRIRTKDRYVLGRNGSKRLIKGRILKQSDNGHGYMQVSFRMNSKTINLYPHRAVATCFIPNPNGYPEVNHIDNDPTNNAVDNLEWCSSEYNIAYRERYGKARNHPVIAINPRTGEVLWFESQSEAARKLGVDQRHITGIVNGKRHTTGSFWFCNADENAVEKTRIKFGDEVAKKVEELLSERKII